VPPQASAGGGLEATSLVDLVVRRLRADILSGDLAPGQRLIEEQLTRRFGTSRAPLREALRLLGQQGLVEHLPRRGVRVVELSPRDIDELFSLRDALEQFALRSALTAGPSAAALERLRLAVEAMERTSRAEQAVAHRDFHLALVGLADHAHLQRVYEAILLQLQLYMATNMRREAEARSPDEGARRHRRLYEVVVSGDVEAALEELARHGARTFLAPELPPDGRRVAQA
jgi:DNA-binding GntR family transcriptional regulator